MQPSSRQACMLVIPPLVERHVGDAAFYWQQRERSAHSPLIDLPALAHFDRLLQAHLDGVGVAGGAGWALAMAELKRWRGAGEAFVCAVPALQRPDAPPSALDEVLAVVAQAPERMRAGVVGALRWAAHALAAARLAAWTHPDADPLRQTLAWQTLARSPELADTKLAARLATALAHPLMEVRAAACAAHTVLMGKALDTAHAAALLRSAPQALRWIAAHHLHGQGVAFDTLARARLQQHHLDTVH